LIIKLAIVAELRLLSNNGVMSAVREVGFNVVTITAWHVGDEAA